MAKKQRGNGNGNGEKQTLTAKDVGTLDAKEVAEPSVPSAAPGTEDEAGKKKKKMHYPGLSVEAEKPFKPTTPVDKKPDDFDPKKHKPLRKIDFIDEPAFLDFRADELELKVAKLRQQASDSRKLGSVQDRARAKKLRAMMSKMDELRTQLESQGIDVDELLGDAVATDDSTETAETDPVVG
jgi:hypothetical protein